MRYTLTPSSPFPQHLRIVLPSSKSISNRALILRALACGTAPIANLSDCDDTRVMTSGLGSGDSGTVDIMGAGTSMRFLTAYFSATPGTHTLTGSARMQQRPIGTLVDALRQLGADIAYAGREGYPPLCIRGRQLAGGRLTMKGDVSSQFISALLMVAPAMRQGLTLTLTGNVTSRPYIDLTLEMMRRQGIAAQWHGADTLQVAAGRYRDTPLTIESDWSAASYWYEVAALSPQPLTIELPGLHADSLQGDSRGAQLFARLGIATHHTPQGVRLTRHATAVERLDEGFADIPDLVQTFAVTCCLLGIPFRFGGVQTLRIKETDRISALVDELRKTGFLLTAEGDHTLAWDGRRCAPLPSPVIETYDDHRMALAFAPAALRLPGIGIDRPEVVSKSYPRFWDDIQTVIHYEREQ
ncbi:MAG: 3-phosphoshikimate 1-carboxyvinyltransferase [Prevotellaceae bacterium]|jgi:3-phosphoshikimate 1-carboxyvinyltransferase|nr:3-phosphoshikimate 1-carboxyvinyltransferase [Prevotellaceae bacterium]